MSNESTHDSEENPELRKLLKELPKKHASKDFEMRLQRQLNEGKSALASEGFLEKLSGAFRIPTFAYSLLTVLVVGVISYYAFFRNIDTPVLQKNEIPSLNDKDLQQSSSDKIETPSGTKPDMIQEEAKTSDARERESRISKQEVPSQQSPGPQQQLNQRSGPSQYRAKQQSQNQEIVKEKAEVVNDAPQQEPISEPQQSIAAPAREQDNAIQQSIQPETKMNVGTETFLQQTAKPSEQLLKKFPGQIKGVWMDTSVRDSFGIRDSIIADSLRKLNELKMKQQKSKRGKPDN